MATYEEAKKAFNEGKSAYLIVKTYNKKIPFPLSKWEIVIHLIIPLIGWIYLLNAWEEYDCGIFVIAKQHENINVLERPDIIKSGYTVQSYLIKDKRNTFDLDNYMPDDWKERTDWVIE